MDVPGSRRECAARSSVARSVGPVLDEHAELRDVIAQIEEAGDLRILRVLLGRLQLLLREHFAREEASEGVLAMIREASPRQQPAEVAQLIAEHRVILGSLDDLAQRVEADEGRPLASVEGEVTTILTRLRAHDARETELLSGALARQRGLEIGRGDEKEQPKSRALQVNLRRTAVDVVIPADHMVLLEITSHLYGVQQGTRQLLREIHHRYVGWNQTIEDLHRRAMSDFPHYIVHERAPEAIDVFCSLYAMAAQEADTPALRETAVRDQLYYLEKAAREAGERLPRVAPVLEQALSRLDAIFRRTPRLAVVSSSRLKRLVEALLAAPLEPAEPLLERSLELLSATLRRVHEDWLQRDDPADWWRERSGAAAEAKLPGPVAAISHARLEACRDHLQRRAGHAGDLRERAERLLQLPDDAQIQRGYLDAATCCESEEREGWRNRLERTHWLIRLLTVEALTSVHQQALSEISHSYLDVLRGTDRESLRQFVRETFDALRRSESGSSSSGFGLIANVGREALATRDPDFAQLAIDEILDSEFPSPRFSGFTEEWRVRVDPTHLRAIRAYLDVIGGDPELARPLIAALVVHLKVGGVFIADTDLFQKDVSRLLNSGIGPVYHQVKHLLRIFPVYFEDIGAEGELREVSSRIDEIGARKDPLCHFLRKQSHVESNPLLPAFVEAIARFWATGDREPLRSYVPASLVERLDVDCEEYAALRGLFGRLVGSEGVGALFELDPAGFERRLAAIEGASGVAREKAALLFRLRKLLGRKYELHHDDLLDRLRAFSGIATDTVEALRRALRESRPYAAFEILLGILERLKDIIVKAERTEGVEDIYRKRHIAAGIPSMYGRYREEKLEAMGLTFRIESMANALFERMIAESNLEYITRNTLRRVAAWLRLMLRALRVDGCSGRGLATGTAMLEQALLAEGISVDQYINIFQFISRTVENLIRIRFLEVYEPVLERLLRRMLESGALRAEPGSDAQETILKVSEPFLRDLIAQSFGLQPLDQLIGKVLRTLTRDREDLDRTTLNLLMTYEGDRCCVPIDREDAPLDGIIYLGNKGYMIKRLAQEGLPVPEGFILTTEVFRCHAAILACDELQRELSEEIRRQVVRLEGLTDSRFGDPRRPLLLSVRSGAAISMPGVLDTFLNVGMTADVAEGFAARSGSPWAAWDAYRRFLQLWGMGCGLRRDLFDTLMRDAKRTVGVAKKSSIPAAEMKEVALRYREFVLDHGVEIAEDPYEQLRICVDLVLRSWHAERARMYRSALKIADEWGTAVIVQNMVYGNLHRRSGTGVALTCDPRRTLGDLQIHGDFIVQAQGDDVVSGLVETFPLTEEQRVSEPKQATVSLERDFPEIYQALLGHARTLIRDQGMFHQEIEFTFESDDPADLYILQTRDTVLSQVPAVPAFVPTEKLERAKLATGIGAGGGALSGRLAHTAGDIAELRRRFPEDPIILARPDTVPDDIPLILQVDGMVTALGGATSHAALVAQRLGHACVVGCRALEVFEDERRSNLAGRELATGAFISINGIDGSVYLGRHPSSMGSRRQTA